MNNREIAIIGMECVLPGACNLSQYWDNLVEGVDAIREIPAGRLNGLGGGSPAGTYDADIPCRRGGFLPEEFRFDPLKFGVMPSIVPDGDPDQFLMLHVIGGALADAGIADDDPVRQSTDVIVGRGGYLTNKTSEIYFHSELIQHLLNYLAGRFPEMAHRGELQQLAEEMRATMPNDQVDTISTCMSNLVASRAANRLNLRGAAYMVDAACASSLLAVEHAVNHLRHGLCNLAVAGGIHLVQTPSFWSIFTQIGAMSTSQHIRPFDRGADGLLIGEGAGAVVLKRLEDARRDGDRVYAIIKGAGVSSDGRDTHLLTSSTKGQIEALNSAYNDAGVDPATIGYLEAHGTATVAGDLAEIETIKGFYGTRDKFPPTRAMGSVKSMIGHTMPAAGIASLIKTALSLSNKCLLPSLHCPEPRKELDDAAFYVNGETRPWIHSPADHPRRAGINAFGFGGINVHLVLEEVLIGAGQGARPIQCKPHNAGNKRTSELAVFSGSSPQEISKKLQRLENFLAQQQNQPTLEDIAYTLSQEVDFGHSCKLSLVCEDFAHLRRMVSLCLARLQEGTPQFDNIEEIYFATDASEPVGKVAGIFPGMGFPGLIGNYPDHVMELCRHFPEARKVFDNAEFRDLHPDDPVPTSIIFSPPSALPEKVQTQLRNRIAAMKVIEEDDETEIEIEPCQRNIAASAVTLCNWVSWILLEELQVPVDMVCGQSQGEIAAMCASRIVDIDEVISRCWQAITISPGHASKGHLAFVAASEQRIAPYLAEVPDTSVAIYIAPEMLIIGGEDVHISSLISRFREEGLIANELPFPPIHTPRFRHLRDELTQIIDMDVRFRRPTCPIYSAITESPFPEHEDDIRELVLSNLDRPLRFWQTIHRMYDDGARIFVQVGGGTLASNIKTILPKPDIVGTAVDLDHRHPVTQLQHLCAVLLSCGVRFDLSYLFRHRSPSKLERGLPACNGQPGRPRSSMKLPLRMDWVPLAVPNDRAQFGSAAVSAAECGLEARAPKQTAEQRTGESGEPVLPFVGNIVHHVAGQEIVTERVLDLDEDLFLHDHALIGAASGKAIESRMSVLPLTMILEVLGETAACLTPGLGLIGFEKASAYSWIGFQDNRTVHLRVTARLESVDPETGVHRVYAEVLSDGKSSASASVLFSDAYREDVKLQFTELSNQRPFPLTVEQLYTEGYLFHGPLFHCVTGIHVLGDQGLVGEITVGPKDRLFASMLSPQLLIDPVVLDGVTQLAGMWVIANGFYVMPAKITKLEFYGTSPPPGTKVLVRVEIRNLSTKSRTVTVDAEVQDGNGNVWMRLEGLGEWLYDYSSQLQDTQRLPARYHIAMPKPLVGATPEVLCTFVSRSDLRHAAIRWLACLFLHQNEWLYFDKLQTLPLQWQWLMGRIAAKDALRIYLAKKMGTEMIHPAILEIIADEAGKPYVRPLDGCPPMPQLSISHTGDCAVAMVAETGCGIDVEPLARDTQGILSTFANLGEIELIDALAAQQPDQAWPTRLWCAKEAVGKALGTGLGGRPADFEAIDTEADGQLLVRYRPTAHTYNVQTVQMDSVILAYALLATV